MKEAAMSRPESVTKMGGGVKRKNTAASHVPDSKKVKNDVEFEVDKLLAHRPSVGKPGKFEFLVRWVGFSEEDDTWEPEANLKCPVKLKLYRDRVMHKYGMLKIPDLSASEIQEKLEEMRAIVNEIPEALVPSEVAELKLIYGDPSGKDPSELVAAALELRNMAEQRLREARYLLLSDRNMSAKEKQNLALKEFEGIIKRRSPREAAVTVENDVDDELPPSDFTYISANIPGEGVTIPDDPIVGCECSSCGVKSKTCCPDLADCKFAYSAAKRVTLPPGMAIYECNSRCKCSSSCPNRVVQLGRQVKVCVFKTANKGWGVRADEAIKKGTYVCDYVGEVITNAEAERRGQHYDAVGRTYLFDLDFATDGQPDYVIDAAKYGNVSHFINHSCEPNLGTYVCYINNLVVTMPQIAFFALRDIRKGEELCFDYSPPPAGGGERPAAASVEQVKEDVSAAKKLDFGGEEPVGETNGEASNSEGEKAEKGAAAADGGGAVVAAHSNGVGPAPKRTGRKRLGGRKPPHSSTVSPSNEASPRHLGIKAYGSPKKPNPDSSGGGDGENGEAAETGAMTCYCGAPTCRGVVFLRGRDTEI